MTETLKQQREAFAAQITDDPDGRAWIEGAARELQRQAMHQSWSDGSHSCCGLGGIVRQQDADDIGRLLDADPEE